jgi:hypothetical protein
MGKGIRVETKCFAVRAVSGDKRRRKGEGKKRRDATNGDSGGTTTL